MQEHRGTGRDRRAAGAPPERRPRVVILEAGGCADVEVLELGEEMTVGACFRYRGTTWTVVGERRGSRVLYASPSVT